MAHWSADNRKAADFALATVNFLVCQDGSEFGTPIHRRFADVGEALGIAVSPFLFFRRAIRRKFYCFPIGSALFVSGLNHNCKAEENPLGPFEILHVGRGEFARPVVTEAKGF